MPLPVPYYLTIFYVKVGSYFLLQMFSLALCVAEENLHPTLDTGSFWKYLSESMLHRMENGTG